MDELVYDMDEMLMKVGAANVDIRIFFTSGLLLMTVLNDTMGMGMVAVDATCDLEMEAFEQGIFTTAGMLGITVSSFLWGYLCDSQGRRAMLLISTFSACGASFVSVFMPNYWSFVVVRFLQGIFLAGPSSITPSYMGEFCTKKNLTAVMNYMFMVAASATIYCPTIGFILLPQPWRLHLGGALYFVPWRMQLMLYNLPGLLAALSLLGLPESPEYLLTVGKAKEAFDVINWLALKHTGYSLNVLHPEITPAQIALLLPKRSRNDHLLSPSDIKRLMKPIFQKPILRKFLLSSLVLFGLFFIGNGLGIWYPSLRGAVRANEENTTQLAICDISNYIEYAHKSEVCIINVQRDGAFDSIAMGVFYTASFMLQGILLRSLSRKQTIVSELVISGLFGLSLFWINDSVVSLFALIVFISLPTLSTAVMSGALVHMIPTNCRGTAICLCMMAGRLGAVMGSYTMGLFYESVCALTMLVFISFIIVCIVTVLHLPLDAKAQVKPSLYASFHDLQTAREKNN